MSFDHRDKAVSEQQNLISQSWQSIHGQRIYRHRAIHHFPFPRSRLKETLLLPLTFTLAAWPAIKILSTIWVAFFKFWIAKLHIDGSVSLKLYGPVWLNIFLPYFTAFSDNPDANDWWFSLTLTLIALLASFLIPEKLLPFRYFVRLLTFIQFTSLLFFAFFPEKFPHTLSHHLERLLLSGLCLMIIIPWVHALIYYIFGFSLAKKILFTLGTLAFIALLLPFMILAHTYLVQNFSLLLLPVLYFVFGLFLLIMTCVGLYGWAMSWKGSDYE